MFGGGETQAQTQTVASGVDIQSSCYGGVVPVIYGRTRLTGNLIWYGDFQAIPVQSSSANGGKGGDSGHGSTSYDYKASFIFALGEGPLADVQNVWASKTKTAFGKSNLGFANGNLGQAPWGYLTTKFPDKALSYAGTGYVHAMAYDLGQSAQMPNLSYEVTGIGANVIGGLPDADPGLVVGDVLTNPRYGVGFPTPRIPSGGFGVFSNYCRAAGLMISPVFDTQSDAAGQLNAIVQSCNAEFVWSGSLLTIIPYGDQDLSANGGTYTAPSAPLFSLTDDDFLYEQGQDPVQCSRARPSDQMNAIRFEFLDRAHSYNANIVEAKNQAAIEAYGLRGEQPEQMHHFCDAGVAKKAATLKLQRQSVRNVYSFTLGWRYCLLDPMDIVEITDAGLGLDRQWVRILSLEEDENGNIKVTAEEYLGGTGHAPLYDFEPGSPYDVDYNVSPGNVNAPLIFEPPPVMLAARSITAPQIMIGASGLDHNWGGCDVYLSLDDTTYKRMGRIAAPSRQGVLANTLASGANPDTTHTLSVDMSESGRALGSGTTADADAFRTLCYVDGELIAYETAVLTGADTYGLTYLRRGVYGSGIEAHAAGTEFCRLDESVKSFDLPITPVSYVGKTLHLKFLSFNIYGGGQQELSDVTSIPYVPGGSGVFVFPPTGVSFTVGAEQQKDGSWISFGVVAWTASQDPLFDQYEVQYRLHSGPGPWISWRGGPDTTSFRISPLPHNTAYDVQVRAVRTSGPFYSAWAQALNVITTGKTTAPPAPTGLSVHGGYRQITLDWTASAENDVAWYEIWEDTVTGTTPPGTATRIALVNATHYVRPGLNLSDTRFYWLRAQDTSGNFSAYTAPGHATTNAVDAADITGQLISAQIANAAVTGAKIANDAIDITKIATGFGLAASYTGSMAALTSGPLVYEGSLVIRTNDGKLYRYTGGAWTVATDGGDINPGSVVTAAIAAGAITTALLDAGAVTASKAYFGDTTNLITDPIFQDADYWRLVNPGTGPAIVSYTAPDATGAIAIGSSVALAIDTANIPAGSALSYGARNSVLIPVTKGLKYRASCNASATSGTNKTAQLFIQWFDATTVQVVGETHPAFIANAMADTTTMPTVGPYSPSDLGADHTAFQSTNGSTIEIVAQAPSNAGFARLFFAVQGGGTGAPAGTGVGWRASAMRFERQTVGTLIQDGVITTDHIDVLGLDAGVITAGTITGDRMNANFIDSQRFTTTHTAGQPYIEINGQSNTFGGHQNGPWFLVNDGAHNRAIIGQLQDKWGIWINDASGNPFFQEYQLANGVVVTDHLDANAATAPAVSTLASSFSGGGSTSFATVIPSFTVHMNDAGVLNVIAGFVQNFSGGTPPIWFLRLFVDGTQVAEIGGGAFTVCPVITWADTVVAGSHTVRVTWAADSNGSLDDGSVSVLGAYR